MRWRYMLVTTSNGSPVNNSAPDKIHQLTLNQGSQDETTLV